LPQATSADVSTINPQNEVLVSDDVIKIVEETQAEPSVELIVPNIISVEDFLRYVSEVVGCAAARGDGYSFRKRICSAGTHKDIAHLLTGADKYQWWYESQLYYLYEAR
jgi:hypothetical protein